jgi:hypothetical protein
MNNKHTIPMLRAAAKSLGHLLMPQAAGLKLQTFDDKGAWGVALVSSRGDLEVGGGKTEREALFELAVNLGRRVGKL